MWAKIFEREQKKITLMTLSSVEETLVRHQHWIRGSRSGQKTVATFCTICHNIQFQSAPTTAFENWTNGFGLVLNSTLNFPLIVAICVPLELTAGMFICNTKGINGEAMILTAFLMLLWCWARRFWTIRACSSFRCRFSTALSAQALSLSRTCTQFVFHIINPSHQVWDTLLIDSNLLFHDIQIFSGNTF